VCRSVIFSAKSKTFLVGEYSVLFGGSAILLLTAPEFQLATEKSTKSGESPAWLEECPPAYGFYAMHENVFRNFHLEFTDPFRGTGGFGASSAKFVLLYRMYLHLTGNEFHLDPFLAQYRSLSEGKDTGPQPSGADCVAQLQGCHTFFDAGRRRLGKIDWNFPNVDFAIFKTGLKVATHQHLRHVPTLDISRLEECTANVRRGFFELDGDLLARNVQDFFNTLREMRLVLPATSDFVDKFLEVDGVLAAKGCGALSADAILVIFRKGMRDKVNDVGRRLRLAII
jgi:mevalonate kinase